MPIRDEAELVIKVTGKGSENIEDFTKKVKAADDASSDLAQTLLGLFSTAAVVQFGKESIRVFSDLEETTAKFYEVFKGVEGAADQAAQTLIDRFGASELSAKSMLSQTGDLLVGFGFARDEALKLSEQVAQLGSDIASFSNYAGGAEGATYAITKAMLGETEQAKMLGIAIKTDSEEYKQIYNRIKETQGVTETQAKALTALQIAFQQKGDAMGDFERTMGSIANQGRMLDTQLEALKANVGRGLQGAFREAQGALLDLLDGFNDLNPEQQDFIVQTGAIFSGLLAVKTAYMTNNVLIKLNSVLMGENTSATVTNTVATEANTKAKKAGASAARGLGSAMAGVAKSFVPLLIASAAIEGLLYLMTKSAKEAEAFAKSTGDLAKQARQVRQAHEEAIPVEREMLDRYNKLVSYTDRTKEEQEELVRITDQLNAKYQDLNLSLSGTADAYARLTQEQAKHARATLEDEISKTADSIDALLSRFQEEGYSVGNRLGAVIFGNFQSMQLADTMGTVQDGRLADIESAKVYLSEIASIKNEAIRHGEDEMATLAAEIEAQVKNWIKAKESMEELEKSGEVRTKNSAKQDAATNQAIRDLQAEREKYVQDAADNYRKQYMDQYELVNTLGKEADALREKLNYARSRKRYSSEKEREKDLLKLTKEYEQKKYEYKNALNQRLIENNRKEKEEEIRALKEVSAKRIEELKKQYDTLEKEAEARKELIDRYTESSSAYRSTVQEAVDANSERGIELQSRMFITGGSNAIQSLQQKTADNSEAQKKIMDEIKRIEKDTKDNVEDIKRAIENFRFSVV
ncbi:MAG: hypothetical protein J6T08_08980 [Lentisphaeria bacterium]|nr:hypothetical protein [Lentisphaeria bacterium]